MVESYSCAVTLLLPVIFCHQWLFRTKLWHCSTIRYGNL